MLDSLLAVNCIHGNLAGADTPSAQHADVCADSTAHACINQLISGESLDKSKKGLRQLYPLHFLRAKRVSNAYRSRHTDLFAQRCNQERALAALSLLKLVRIAVA